MFRAALVNYELFTALQIIHLIFRGKHNISMLEVKVIIEFFNLVDITGKKKSVINIPFINYWSKFRPGFFKPKNFVYT